MMFDRIRRTAGPGSLVAALLLLGGGAHARAELIEAELTAFEPTGRYLLVVDGAEVPEAQLFSSQRAGSALLVMTPELTSPVLLEPRNHEVTAVKADGVMRLESGAVELSPSALGESLGGFEVDAEVVRFQVHDRRVELRERPWLLGSHNAEDLLSYSADYAFHAREYQPSEAVLRWLRDQPHEVRLRFFFGSWCPFCIQALPKVLKVAEELGDTKVTFEFYGLPKPFGGEPEARRAGIIAVPSGVVYRNGKEVGRITGARWRIPELALRNALMGALPEGS